MQTHHSQASRPVAAKPPANPFEKREVLLSSGYLEFHRVLVRDQNAALKMMKSSPQCVVYAALDLAALDLETSGDAATVLTMALRSGIDISHVLGMVAARMYMDEYPAMRAKALGILELAKKLGSDMSYAKPVLEIAVEGTDRHIRDASIKLLEGIRSP
jgi:hypothetical protein